MSSTTNDKKIETVQQEEVPDWIADVQSKMLADNRKKPWEKTFGDAVNNEDGVQEDLICVRGDNDVQHSSVAA